MSFLGIGYGDRFNGQHKTVFRSPGELVYTANPQDPIGIIQDDEWYDNAVQQVEVWEHNIDTLQQADLPLTFEEYESDIMFCEVQDDRIDSKLMTPAIRIEDYEWVEPYGKTDTFDDITDSEERQIREMQEELDQLIEEGRLAVKEREHQKNDYRGPGCLRQWGRNENKEVFLLEFGEYHHRLEGPHTGAQFLEEHGIEKKDHGVRSPIMVGDVGEYRWEMDDGRWNI